MFYLSKRAREQKEGFWAHSVSQRVRSFETFINKFKNLNQNVNVVEPYPSVLDYGLNFLVIIFKGAAVSNISDISKEQEWLVIPSKNQIYAIVTDNPRFKEEAERLGYNVFFVEDDESKQYEEFSKSLGAFEPKIYAVYMNVHNQEQMGKEEEIEKVRSYAMNIQSNIPNGIIFLNIVNYLHDPDEICAFFKVETLDGLNALDKHPFVKTIEAVNTKKALNFQKYMLFKNDVKMFYLSKRARIEQSTKFSSKSIDVYDILKELEMEENSDDAIANIIGLRGETKPEEPIGGFSIDPQFFNSSF